MRHLLASLIGIGRASLVDDTGSVQVVQVTEGAAGNGFADRVSDKVRRVMEFGFTSSPPIDSEVLLLRRGGDRSRGMVIGTNHRPSRPTGLQPGDVAIYDVRGAKVTLAASGLTIDCAGLPAVVKNFASLTVQGDLHVTGDVISRSAGTGVSLGGLHDAYNLHKHGSSPTTDHPV